MALRFQLWPRVIIRACTVATVLCMWHKYHVYAQGKGSAEVLEQYDKEEKSTWHITSGET